MYFSPDFSSTDQAPFARSIATASLAQPIRHQTHLFGLSLRSATRSAMADEIVARALMNQPTRISFVNAHCVNVAQRDAGYAQVLKDSDMLLPDGSGMRIAAKLAGQPMADNLNGTDLFPEICARVAALNMSIYMLGGGPGIARAAADAMVEQYPGLRIAGTRDGFFEPDQLREVLAEINASGAAMVFVGMGVPRQERWIAQYADRLSAPVLLGVGGLFDYYSGRIPRAPMAFRKVGCEWIWRLMQEPRRLTERYIVGNGVFLCHAVLHALSVKFGGGRLSEGAKRGLDVALTLGALIVALPIFLAVAAAIRMEDGGPVFFRQTRIGAGGRPFKMLKFRSMVVDAEKLRAALLEYSDRDATCFKMRHDPRVTRVGRLLRRLSLDELPQLLNVLRGSMSLVGPRPALPQEVSGYQGRSWQRLGGKPGITCTWQVSGRAEIPFERQVEMDIDYLQRRGVLTDIALMARTVPAVITARGAY